jgi:hypothetical protein
MLGEIEQIHSSWDDVVRGDDADRVKRSAANRPVIRDFGQLPFCGRKQPRNPDAWTVGRNDRMGYDNPIVASQPNA